MIFVNFVLCVSLFFFFAFFAGNAGTFFNLDSIIIVLFGFFFSSLAVAVGRYRMYFNGLKQIFRFRPIEEKSTEVGHMVTAVSIMTVVIGLISTAQGLISSALIANTEYSVIQIVSFASFTTVYSVLFVGLLLVPIIYLNK